MANPPVPRTYAARLYQELHDQLIMNTINIFLPVGTGLGLNDPATANLIGGVVHDAFKDAFYAVLSSDIKMVRWECQYIGSIDGVVSESSSIATGLVSNAALPGNVALCLSLRTGLSGRSRRGRIYLGGIPENYVTANEITAELASSINTKATEFLGDIATGLEGQGEVVVISRYANKQLRTEPLVTVVTDMLLKDRVVDSQRRRLTGRGR